MVKDVKVQRRYKLCKAVYILIYTVTVVYIYVTKAFKNFYTQFECHKSIFPAVVLPRGVLYLDFDHVLFIVKYVQQIKYSTAAIDTTNIPADFSISDVVLQFRKYLPEGSNPHSVAQRG